MTVWTNSLIWSNHIQNIKYIGKFLTLKTHIIILNTQILIALLLIYTLMQLSYKLDKKANGQLDATWGNKWNCTQIII